VTRGRQAATGSLMHWHGVTQHWAVDNLRAVAGLVPEHVGHYKQVSFLRTLCNNFEKTFLIKLIIINGN